MNRVEKYREKHLEKNERDWKIPRQLRGDGRNKAAGAIWLHLNAAGSLQPGQSISSKPEETLLEKSTTNTNTNINTNTNTNTTWSIDQQQAWGDIAGEKYNKYKYKYKQKHKYNLQVWGHCCKSEDIAVEKRNKCNRCENTSSQTSALIKHMKTLISMGWA